jgi:hypothetical protein
MLHDFLAANRAELIERCRAKVALRPAHEEERLAGLGVRHDQGYSVDQVLHDYGDLCQAITDRRA